jgi:hypothetical protein
MEQGIFVEPQDFVDHIAVVATGKAFEDQRVVPDADGKTGAVVCVSRAAAHGASRLPDAPRRLTIPEPIASSSGLYLLVS